MIPEYGNLALIFALLISLCLAVIPLAGTFTGRVVWMASARSLATGLWVFTCIAYGILTYAFVTDDYSVAYVNHNSNAILPVYYKVCAVWGGHEGSLLLWTLMLAGWTFAVSCFSKNIPADVRARVLSVLGMVSVGFFSFMLFTSNPFDRILPNVPMQGRDLNPLLQDPGFIFHPPTLYMGYVGFAVVFAFAIAALIGGRLDSAWARWSRPWTNLAWMFLTFGLALGSWWAYYELGWGGWWVWDPVENAAFMPWLAGTALVHSLAASEKRGVFKNWTLLLAIMAFSLSLLGTFLVRSGLLTSVHAFAADPARGLFIFAFLLLVVGGSLTLFAFRAPDLINRTRYSFLSREAFLLANSILQVASCSLVLIGTLFPLATDALGVGKYSVGEDWFNLFFPWFMAVVAVMMGVAVFLNWKNTRVVKIWRFVAIVGSISLVAAIALPFLSETGFAWSGSITVFLGVWVLLSCFSDIVRKLRSAASISVGIKRIPASVYGMHVAHIGFAMCLLGAGLDKIYDDKRDLRMTLDKPVQSTNFTYTLEDVVRKRFHNYEAEIAEIRVEKNGEFITTLRPEKRQYFSGGNMMTEAAIEGNFVRDLYAALGERISETDWAVRVYVFPFVRWVWYGAMLMGFGGLIAIFDKRYAKFRAQRPVELLASEKESSQTNLEPLKNT